MIEKYTNIECYACNEGSFGHISSQDKPEILELLNSRRFAHRVIATPELVGSDLELVIDELESEANEKLSRGEISQTAHFSYLHNCHSLARKFQEKQGWIKVSGYVVKEEQFGNTSIVLRAHSVIRNNIGALFELTVLFTPEVYNFIEHSTGEFGIDLIAHKANSAQGFE